MKIEINNVYGKIVDNLTIDQLAVIQQECQFKVEGSEFKQYAFKTRGRGKFEWDGYRKLFNIQTRRFPIGLLPRVKQLLINNGIQVEIINKRKIDTTKYNYDCDMSMLRDYQKECIIMSCSMGNGIIKCATGGGKTFIAGCTIGAILQKTIFIVHTRDLMYQTIKSFSQLFPHETIGQIGDGVYDPQNITVATMQTLAILGDIKYESNKYDEESGEKEETFAEARRKEIIHKFNTEYKKTVQCVMMDEVQIVSSQMAYNVRFLFEYANYAFGYSASPWRDDGSDLMIEAAFGNRICDVDASFLIRIGYLVKPDIIIKKVRNKISNPGTKYVDVYKNCIVENTLRNIQIMSDAVEQYKLGRNTLVLVTQVKHGTILEEMITSQGVEVTFISGKSGMKKRTKAIQDMRDGKIQLMIATTIADVGLDIPRLESLIEGGAGKSSVTALQRLGRIMRKFDGKSKCYFITYRDNAPYINSHIDSKIEIWRTEPEFNIIEEE